MRRLLPFATLLLAACAGAPRVEPAPQPVVPAPGPAPSNLSGLTQADLTRRFGAPSFQVREGPGLKLQWQNATCVLDAYLYPPVNGAGAASVLHTDARRPGSGETVPVEGCVAGLSSPRP